ncbi:MAG: hypothetical protein N2510_07895 [Ignavibacteria bacterium]|nr:hypothetical protein [Ignavibacteria bacterium]
MNKLKVVLGFSLIVLLMMSGIVLSGLWKDNQTVKDIELTGNVSLSKNDLFSFAKITDSIIYSGGLSLEMIESRLSKHPALSDVSVSRDDGVVRIKVEEKMPFAVVTSGRKIMFIDNNLTLYPVSKKYGNIDLPVISGISDESLSGVISKKDLKALEVARFIISSCAEISRGLYNFISEIDFSDSNGINLITSDDATLIYFLDYSLMGGSYSESLADEVMNEELMKYIYMKLVHLDCFLKQVKLYKPSGSVAYVDMRYDGTVAVKNKN